MEGFDVDGGLGEEVGLDAGAEVGLDEGGAQKVGGTGYGAGKVSAEEALALRKGRKIIDRSG